MDTPKKQSPKKIFYFLALDGLVSALITGVVIPRFIGEDPDPEATLIFRIVPVLCLALATVCFVKARNIQE